MYVNVVFVIRCLYSAVSLTTVREQRLIRNIYYYYYYYKLSMCALACAKGSTGGLAVSVNLLIICLLTYEHLV